MCRPLTPPPVRWGVSSLNKDSMMLKKLKGATINLIIALVVILSSVSAFPIVKASAETLLAPLLLNPTILPPLRVSAANIPAGSITNSELANMAASSVKCNNTSAASSPQDCTALPSGLTTNTTASYDASNNIATASMVQGAIQRTMATVALNLGSSASGVYSFASAGTGFTASFTTSGGAITGITIIYNGGSGYKVGDVLTAGTGTTNAGNQDSFIMINAVSGTAATGATVLYGGSGYTAGTNVAHSTSASFPYSFTLTGTLTGATTFLMTPGTLLTQSNQWYVNNNTTGAYTTTFKQSAQSGGVSTDTATGLGVIILQGTNNAAAITTDGVTDVWCVSGACAQGNITINNNAASAPTPPTGTVLQLSNADATATVEQFNSFGAPSELILSRAAGSGIAPTTVIASTTLGILAGGGYDGTNWSAISNSPRILFTSATNSWSTSDHGGRLLFYTLPDGTVNDILGMTLDQSQHLFLSNNASAPPTIASSACGSGTNGSISGSDQAGVITIGASAATTCTVSFGSTWNTAPRVCAFSPGNAAAAAATTLPYSTITNSSTWVLHGAVLASTTWGYHCF